MPPPSSTPTLKKAFLKNDFFVFVLSKIQQKYAPNVQNGVLHYTTLQNFPGKNSPDPLDGSRLRRSQNQNFLGSMPTSPSKLVALERVLVFPQVTSNWPPETLDLRSGESCSDEVESDEIDCRRLLASNWCSEKNTRLQH